MSSSLMAAPPAPRRRTASEREAFRQGRTAGWRDARRFVPAERRAEFDAYARSLTTALDSAEPEPEALPA